jgi:hypothetical protein
LFFNLRKAKSHISALVEGDLHPDQVRLIARQLGVAEQDVVDMNRRLGGDVSLNAPIGQEGDTGEWQDWLVDDSDSIANVSSCADIRPSALHAHRSARAVQSGNAIMTELAERPTQVGGWQALARWNVGLHRVRSPILRYGFAVASVAVALGLSLLVRCD